jgi:hypothetical protein
MVMMLLPGPFSPLEYANDWLLSEVRTVPAVRTGRLSDVVVRRHFKPGAGAIAAQPSP